MVVTLLVFNPKATEKDITRFATVLPRLKPQWTRSDTKEQLLVNIGA
jgi:hypothetical protein